MDFLYESNNMPMDQRVLISLQYKKRKGSALAVIMSKSITLRGIPLHTVHERLQQTFKSYLNDSDVGFFERPDQQILAQLQYYERDPEAHTLKYVNSKSLTIPNINLTTALRRIKAAFSRTKK